MLSSIEQESAWCVKSIDNALLHLEMFSERAHAALPMIDRIIDYTREAPFDEEDEYRLAFWTQLRMHLITVHGVPQVIEKEKDDCQICQGRRGGVKGNENVDEGVIICDYCSSDRMTFDQVKAETVTEPKGEQT
jgi:hypothetical protein